MKPLLLGLALLCSAGCFAAKRSSDPVARDQEVVRDVSWKLRDPRFAQVQVSCRDGIVALTGTVTTGADRDDAVSIAGGVTSVREVRADLKVRSR